MAADPATVSAKRPSNFDEDGSSSKRPKRENNNREDRVPKPNGKAKNAESRKERSRSRSRSPVDDAKREGRRDRHRERDGGRERDRKGDRNRSTSRERHKRDKDRGRDREDRGEPPKGPKSAVPTGPAKQRPPTGPAAERGHNPHPEPGKVNGEDAKPKADPYEGLNKDETEMMKVMGFHKWRSTKNTKVPGNDKNYAVRKENQTVYRQYMNRPGGFNRPLSPSRQ